jgi:(2Fe-2S) ferredoxin
VVAYPEGVWYRLATKEDVDAFLESHLRDGGRLTDRLLPPDTRVK